MADTLFVDATTTVNGTPIIAAWMNDVNTNTYTILAGIAGTNSITGTGAVTVTVGYPRGVAFRFLPVNNNTGATTINISGLGVKNLTKFGTDPLVANDLRVGMWAYIAYDGVQFQLINPRTTDFLFPTGTLPFSNVSGTVPVVQGGTGATTAQAAKTNLLIAPEGQCQVTLSGANILLSRYNGSYITINGVQEIIPTAGVTLAPAGAAANTRYYIYVFMSAGTMTLEFSTTVPVVDTATGVRVKTGDVTRTLVGQAQSTAGSIWSDTATFRGVISWFNKRPIQCIIPLVANISTPNAGFTELDPTYRVSFLSWSGDVVDLHHTGTMNVSAVATGTVTLWGVSGVVGTNALEGGAQFTSAVAGFNGNATCRRLVPSSADGFSVVGMAGVTAGGSVVLVGSGSAGGRCTLNAVIQG